MFHGNTETIKYLKTENFQKEKEKRGEKVPYEGTCSGVEKGKETMYKGRT